MNILIIHQNFVADDQPGGTRHLELARYLVQAGHRVTIVASDVDYLTGQRVAGTGNPANEQQIDGVRVLRASTLAAYHRNYFWRAVSFLSFACTSFWVALRAGRVDVVVGTSPPLFQVPTAWLVAVVRRRPLVLEVRDLWPEFAIAMGILTNAMLIRTARWVETFLYDRSACLLVNSPAYRDYLIDKGVAPDKIRFVPNGVDSAAFDPESDGASLRQRWDVNGKFVVAYAGALGQANDIGTILRAADHLRTEKGIHFVLAGDGKERPRLQRQATRRNLVNVTFAGAFPKRQMREVLAAADCCVATLQNIPMLRTTYPNKVFDYLAAGRPIVLAIDGPIRQVVERAGAGVFVPPGDDLALAAAVRHFYEHRDEARRRGRAGAAFVRRHFDRRDQARQFERYLREVADRRRNRQGGPTDSLSTEIAGPIPQQAPSRPWASAQVVTCAAGSDGRPAMYPTSFAPTTSLTQT